MLAQLEAAIEERYAEIHFPYPLCELLFKIIEEVRILRYGSYCVHNASSHSFVLRRYSDQP